MLNSLSVILGWTAILALVLLALGLVQPWWVLWWQDTQNRLQVIKLYGSLAAMAYLTGKLLLLIFS